jgi:hypothetical protein
VKDEIAFEIDPQPSPEDSQAILAAVREVIGREAELAGPASWRLAGWTAQRVGITDLARWVPSERRWSLSAHLGWGGRPFSSMIGRGDQK